MSNASRKLPQPFSVPNTLRLSSLALHALTFNDEDDLPTVSYWSQRLQPVRVVGGGSNLVLPQTLDGLTILVRNRGIRLAGQCESYRYVEVAAGEDWHNWVAYAQANDWPGLENLALIPGTVGAAPVQNIGAYGLEVAQHIHTVRVWDFLRQELITLTREQCQFGYRDSVFKRLEGAHYLIVSVCFALPLTWLARLDYPELRERVAHRIGDVSRVTSADIFEAVVEIRRQKLPDPLAIPNAGSFFKNPVVSAGVYEALRSRHPEVVAYPQAGGSFKLAAAWLIDQCGWKGRRCGPIQVHPRQALVLTNTGGADAGDVLKASRLIERDVKARFDVSLEMEPGCWA